MFKQTVQDKIFSAICHLSENEAKYEGIHAEIGCNNEIIDLLTEISQSKQYTNFVIVYKSK